MSTLETARLRLAIAGRVLLADLDLTLAPGTCWALLGANGAGKTTLLAALAGLAAPAAGDIRLEGRALGAWPRRLLAQQVGILLQDETESFWGSTLDYVMLGALARDGGLFARDDDAAAAARAALAEVELVAHAAQPFRTLSGGERQRARIAQLVVQDPAIWLLDEPLNHLDLAHQLSVMTLLAARAAAGRTVVMALHEPIWAARYCSHALLLYDSGGFSVGAAANVLTQGHLEAAYGCRLEPIGGADSNLFFPVRT
jgi:iron complex transport system ATP-binding protein